MKKRLNINEEWLFVEEYDEESNIALANIEFEETVKLPYVFSSPEKISVFKKTVQLSEGYKNLFLEIKECSGTAQIYLNSQLLGSHYGSNTCFRFDITDVFISGQPNEIVIMSCNINNDFGLLGEINLVLADEIYFDLMDDGSCGIYVSSNLKGINADIKISTLISGKAVCASTEYTIYDSDNQQVCILQQPSYSHDFVYTLSDARVWTVGGIAHPNLYTLKAKLFCADSNKIYDEVDIKFGIRSLDFNDYEFIFNSNILELRGVTLKHNTDDFRQNLSAVYQTDMSYIHGIGANLIKFTNNHFCSEFYELCNEEGILVNHDVTFLPKDMSNSQTKKSIRSYIVELLKQNHNHPSLCFWNLEDSIIEELELQDLFYKKLLNLIKKMNKERASLNDYKELVDDAGHLYDRKYENRREKGIISWDNHKRDKYYYYKMFWSGKNIVHICREEVPLHISNISVNISILSSCGNLSIYANGERLQAPVLIDNNIYQAEIPLNIGENRITVNSEQGCGDTISIKRVEVVEE